MSDFHAQLERQLLEAGRRRAERGGWRRALDGRGRRLLALAALLLAGMVAAASMSLPGSGSSPSAPAGGGVPPAPSDASGPTVTASPARAQSLLRRLRATSVAIYNGTTITGLARDVGDRLAAHGVTIGEIASAADQQQTQTVVSYRLGAREQARLVARILGVRDVHPLTAAEAALSPRADVVVVVGADSRGG